MKTRISISLFVLVLLMLLSPADGGRKVDIINTKNVITVIEAAGPRIGAD